MPIGSHSLFLPAPGNCQSALCFCCCFVGYSSRGGIREPRAGRGEAGAAVFEWGVSLGSGGRVGEVGPGDTVGQSRALQAPPCSTANPGSPLNSFHYGVPF